MLHVRLLRAKEEGLQIEVHWQDADSSSSNAVKEFFSRGRDDDMWRSCGTCPP